MAHNKTLAAQLYQEFRRFFPHNAVEYFVSYYDYYQPEAYVPASDTYIEKEATINDEIDRMRLSATRSLFERRDVIIVASVSCIYGLGSPEAYYGMVLPLDARPADQPARRSCASWSRSSTSATTSTSAAARSACAATSSRCYPSYEEHALRIELFGDEIDELVAIDPLTGKTLRRHDRDLDLPEVASTSRRATTRSARSRRSRPSSSERRGDLETRRQAARGAAPAPADDVRPRDDPRDRLLPRHRELLAAPDRPRAGRAAADAARLPAEGRDHRRRREPPDRAAGARHVRRRPVAQGGAGRPTASACRRRSTTGR